MRNQSHAGANMIDFTSYFGDVTKIGKVAFYTLMASILVVYSLIGLAAPLLRPVCTQEAGATPGDERGTAQRVEGIEGLEGGLEDAPNPSYRPDPCRWRRYDVLLGLNPWEAELCCRVLVSMLMGTIIGFERRRADRPAGVRTMAMVCLGACVFTFNSMFAFVDGTMGWDASRVSAAIPSGVGFLGAASIWKGTQPKDGAHGEVHAPEVHGLTTATSVWFSAAVGLLCGGGLYVPAFFATALSVVYLRFAPRLDRETQAEDELDEYKELDVELDAQLRGMPASRNASSGTISSFLRHDQRNPSMDRMSSMSSISSFFGARCNPLSVTEPLNPSGTAYRVERRDSLQSETSRKPRSPPRRPSLNL